MTFWPHPSRFSLARACGIAWGPLRPTWPKRDAWKPDEDQRIGLAVSKIAQTLAVFGRPALALVASGQLADEFKITAHQKRLRLALMADHVADDLEMRRPFVHWRAAEVPIVFHVPSGSARLTDEETARRPPDQHLGAILDLVEVRMGNKLAVIDYKSGYQQARSLDVEEDDQLRSYALFAGRAWKVPTVTVEIRHVSEDGVRLDPTEHDHLEQGIVERQTRDLLASLETAVDPRPNRHCRRCPILTACPVTTTALARVVADQDSFPLVSDVADLQGPEHAAAFVRRLRMIEEAIPKLWTVADQWVEQHGDVVLSETSRYGKVEKKGTESVSLVPPGAASIVRKHLGDGAGWNEGVELVASKASLERGVKARLKELGEEQRGALKARLDPLLGELRGVGAIKQGAPATIITEFSIKKSKGEAA